MSSSYSPWAENWYASSHVLRLGCKQPVGANETEMCQVFSMETTNLVRVSRGERAIKPYNLWAGCVTRPEVTYNNEQLSSTMRSCSVGNHSLRGAADMAMPIAASNPCPGTSSQNQQKGLQSCPTQTIPGSSISTNCPAIPGSSLLTYTHCVKTVN